MHEATGQVGTVWWFTMRERAAVLFRVMYACVLQKRAAVDRVDMMEL